MNLFDLWDFKISKSKSLLVERNGSCPHCGSNQVKINDIDLNFHTWAFHVPPSSNNKESLKLHDQNDHSQCDYFDLDLPILEGMARCSNGCASGSFMVYDEDSDKWVSSIGVGHPAILKMMQNKASVITKHFQNHVDCEYSPDDYECPELKKILIAQEDKIYKIMDQHSQLALDKWLNLDAD